MRSPRLRVSMLASTIVLASGCQGSVDVSTNPDAVAITSGSVPRPDFECDLFSALSGSRRFLISDGVESTTATIAGVPRPVLRTRSSVANDELVFLREVPDLVDESAFQELSSVTGRVVLFVNVADVGNGEVRPIALVAGTLTDSNVVKLAGRCASRWQSAIEGGAASLGRVADPEFLAAAADLSTVEAVAISAAGPGRQDPTQIWLSTPEAQRSLDVGDVPATERANFFLTALVPSLRGDVATPLFVRLSCARGIIVTYEVRGTSGPLPVMIPNEELAITVAVSSTQDFGEPVFAETIATTNFSASYGNRLNLTIDKLGAISVELSVLDSGELERLTGMTREELEALRADLLSDK